MNPSLTLKVIDAAKAAQKETGCLASVALGQWALESGWGKHACAPNNYWGIKWFTGCRNPYAVQRTKEYIKGSWVMEEARFQAFPTLEAGFVAHGDLLMNPLGPYKSALPFASDWRRFVEAIAPIYATDPDYEHKLWAIITDAKLDQFDK